MKNNTPLLYLSIVFISLVSYASSGLALNEIDSADKKIKKSQEAVIFSSKYRNLNLKKAYNLQKAYVKNSVSKGEKIIGYKAGLTRESSAQKYGLSGPISGVLINEPLSGDGLLIQSNGAHKLMLEQEIAYRFIKETHKGMTLEELKQSIDAVAPAVELPDISFPSTDYNGLDIIANNALAYKFIIGEWQPVPVDIDNIDVSLSCGADLLAKGKSSNVMGGQWEALLWMVNHLSDQGYSIQKNQIVITGSLINMQEAGPCAYTANFGELGKMTFTIET